MIGIVTEETGSYSHSHKTCLLEYEYSLVNCNVLDKTCVIVDFFPDECSEDAAVECSEFRPEVPLSTQFDPKVFSAYCR